MSEPRAKRDTGCARPGGRDRRKERADRGGATPAAGADSDSQAGPPAADADAVRAAERPAPANAPAGGGPPAESGPLPSPEPDLDAWPPGGGLDPPIADMPPLPTPEAVGDAPPGPAALAAQISGVEIAAERATGQTTAFAAPFPVPSPVADELAWEPLAPTVAAPPVLPPGAVVDELGRLRIREVLETRGRLNRYRATWEDADGAERDVELREGAPDDPSLRTEVAVLEGVQYAMLPHRYASFERDGRLYLALDATAGRTLAAALAAGLAAEQAASIVLQLTQLVRRLHQGGWALAGLAPEHVTLGQPLRLTQLGGAVRLGEPPDRAFLVPGYSAPELARREPTTGGEDVYTLGALLYRALAGAPLPEQGAELAALPAAVPIPGAPQLLTLALAPAERRADLETFYRQLLAFKQGLAREPLGLVVASGTTIGLNPARTTNEDACGHLGWTALDAERAAHVSVLCLSDGMGGMDAGEVASRAAVRAALGQAAEVSQPDPVELARAAARAVFGAAAGRTVGATFTCVVVRDGGLTLGHLGDSRAYLLRAGERALVQLSRDHSLVAAMVAGGVLTPEQARHHPASNQVLRSLGGQREVPTEHVDTLAAADLPSPLPLRPGDRLLLCSDGVWGVLEDEELAAVLLDARDETAAVRETLARVLRAGAPDNATLIVARCVPIPAG